MFVGNIRNFVKFQIKSLYRIAAERFSRHKFNFTYKKYIDKSEIFFYKIITKTFLNIPPRRQSGVKNYTTQFD
jgi:hypothetical protein